MKPIIKKILLWSAIIAAIFAVFLFILDVFVMPNYVKSPEVKVPDVLGLEKEAAADLLKKNNLNPVFETPRYDENIPKDHIIFQKPEAGSTVKENRRVYLHISNGNPLTKMPYLIDKTLRDAQITIERMGFVLSEVEEVNSEAKANTIVEQSPNEGANLKRGTKIKLKISVGPNKGQVRVPDLLGMSLKEATETLQMNSLMVGNVSYESSNNLLPNTVITQFPSKSTLVNVGETVDLFVTKN